MFLEGQRGMFIANGAKGHGGAGEGTGGSSNRVDFSHGRLRKGETKKGAMRNSSFLQWFGLVRSMENKR